MIKTQLMLFTSWIALCGWNKLISSLLKAIYSIHTILFEPHARLPSFLLGSTHQAICDTALCVSPKCHAMPSPVGPAQHTPRATPDAIQSQHKLYPGMKFPWGWRSFELHSWLLVLCCPASSPTPSLFRMVSCSWPLHDSLHPTDKYWQHMVHCP